LLYNKCVKDNNKLNLLDYGNYIRRSINNSNDNVEKMWNCLNKEDQQLFTFQMKELDWSKYLVNHYKGIRLYLLKEDDSTLERSRVRYKR